MIGPHRLPLKGLKITHILVDYEKDVTDGFIKHNMIHLSQLLATVDDVRFLKER